MNNLTPRAGGDLYKVTPVRAGLEPQMPLVHSILRSCPASPGSHMSLEMHHQELVKLVREWDKLEGAG